MALKKDDLLKMLDAEQHIRKGAPCEIEVQGQHYKVKQISNSVRRRISALEKEVYLLEQQHKEGFDSLRVAKRVDKKIRTLHSKTAAYYLLNNIAIFFPFIFAIKWRLLDLKDSEVTFRINEAGMGNKGADFFLANWQITKAALALSTRLIGDGVEQYQKRMESAERMVAKDDSPTKTDKK